MTGLTHPRYQINGGSLICIHMKYANWKRVVILEDALHRNRPIRAALRIPWQTLDQSTLWGTLPPKPGSVVRLLDTSPRNRQSTMQCRRPADVTGSPRSFSHLLNSSTSLSFSPSFLFFFFSSFKPSHSLLPHRLWPVDSSTPHSSRGLALTRVRDPIILSHFARLPFVFTIQSSTLRLRQSSGSLRAW